jgi:4-carboxymuconolactone decarboxylase
MGVRRSTSEDHLRALAAGQAAVLEARARMQVSTLERSNLDEETYLLVRLAALVATDAASVSYGAHLGGRGDGLVLSTTKVLATFMAIAPVVGSARVLSAASELTRAGLLLGGPGQSPAEAPERSRSASPP